MSDIIPVAVASTITAVIILIDIIIVGVLHAVINWINQTLSLPGEYRTIPPILAGTASATASPTTSSRAMFVRSTTALPTFPSPNSILHHILTLTILLNKIIKIILPLRQQRHIPRSLPTHTLLLHLLLAMLYFAWKYFLHDGGWNGCHFGCWLVEIEFGCRVIAEFDCRLLLLLVLGHGGKDGTRHVILGCDILFIVVVVVVR
mmetsp:Transcript_24939/g.53784  ORF Transcript_24939/g.53784 Transcript_24939/m.53784 type:complete len:204 (+) Transcript_24939:2563-3174(+)